MSNRRSRGRAAADKAARSWAVHTGYTDRPHTYAHHPTAESARAAARAKTTDDTVTWVTVFPPIDLDSTKPRLIHKWSRARGWRTMTASQHDAEQRARRTTTGATR